MGSSSKIKRNYSVGRKWVSGWTVLSPGIGIGAQPPKRWHGSWGSSALPNRRWRKRRRCIGWGWCHFSQAPRSLLFLLKSLFLIDWLFTQSLWIDGALKSQSTFSKLIICLWVSQHFLSFKISHFSIFFCPKKNAHPLEKKKRKTDV